MQSGKALRNWWVKIIAHNLRILRDEQRDLDEERNRSHSHSPPPRPHYLSSLATSGHQHPRGAPTRTKTSSPSSRPLDSESDSDSASDSSSYGLSDDGGPPKQRSKSLPGTRSMLIPRDLHLIFFPFAPTS